MLEFELVKTLRAFTLDLSLEVGAEAVVLAGPSGAGKTTVLKAIAGLVRPEAGSIRMRGELWFDHRRGVWREPEHRGVGYLFQDYALFPHLSVLSNVCFGLAGMDRASRRHHGTQLLERFGIVHLASARPPELSGGERQRVALARALARQPSCLLLDEPLAALDATTRPQAARELRGLLAEAQVPAIVVSHDFIEATTLAQRIAVVDRGRIAQSGSFEQLAATPQTAFVADFCGANLLRGWAQAARAGLTQVALDSGRSVVSTDSCEGPVGVAVFPWDVTVDAGGPPADGASSRLNRLAGTIGSVTVVGNRARVVIQTPQPLVAEITAQSATRLGLRQGVAVTAAWKATATRLVLLE